MVSSIRDGFVGAIGNTPLIRLAGASALIRVWAAARGASLEDEARRSIAASVGMGREEAVARLDEVRGRIGRPPGPSTLDDLRHDRARD